VSDVLASIRKEKLRLIEKKGPFGVTETSFVGYGISADGIDTDHRKIEAHPQSGWQESYDLC
jgi:hypothetical protein